MVLPKEEGDGWHITNLPTETVEPVAKTETTIASYDGSKKHPPEPHSYPTSTPSPQKLSIWPNELRPFYPLWKDPVRLISSRGIVKGHLVSGFKAAFKRRGGMSTWEY